MSELTKLQHHIPWKYVISPESLVSFKYAV